VYNGLIITSLEKNKIRYSELKCIRADTIGSRSKSCQKLVSSLIWGICYRLSMCMKLFKTNNRNMSDSAAAVFQYSELWGSTVTNRM